MALMWAQLEAPPPRLTERRPELPPAVDEVIAAAMAKSPAGRYATCRDFAAALAAACEPELPAAVWATDGAGGPVPADPFPTDPFLPSARPGDRFAGDRFAGDRLAGDAFPAGAAFPAPALPAGGAFPAATESGDQADGSGRPQPG